MFTKFEFTNNTSNTIDFLATPAANGYASLQSINYELIVESVDRPRGEANASWGTKTRFKRLLVHCEGEINADTSAHFNTFKNHSFVNFMLPAPELITDDYNHGTLTVRYDGESHDWTLPVSVVDAPLIPITSVYATRADFTFTFRATRPYFYIPFSDTYIWVL